MTTQLIKSYDVDKDKVVSRLRDLAYDIEEGNAPVVSFEEATGLEADNAATISISVEVLASRQSFTVNNVGIILEEDSDDGDK